MNISFTIQGEPVAKGRPRISTRGGYARAYTPKKTKDFEELIKYTVPREDPLWEQDLHVEVKVFKKIPKAFNKKKKSDALRGILRPKTRPDIDNYLKTPLDALNGHIFKDDSQVVSIHAEKWYSEEPRLEVTVRTYDPQD